MQVESKQDSSPAQMESGTEILVDLGDKGSTKILCLNSQNNQTGRDTNSADPAAYLTIKEQRKIMSTSISILGNTGREVELRYTPQGLPVASFSMASNTIRNTPEGKQKKTDWFNVTAFGKVAETLARNLRKGSQILVQGKLTFNPWLSRDGEPRVGADVVLQDFEFAGGMPASSRPAESTVEVEAYTGGDALPVEGLDANQIPVGMVEAAHQNETVAEPYAGQF